jgi:hypothetical protein
MKNYYITIMSIDPDDHYGREQGDDHQKYGLSVQANNKKDAEEKGAEKFGELHPGLPIFWLRAEEE